MQLIMIALLFMGLSLALEYEAVYRSAYGMADCAAPDRRTNTRRRRTRGRQTTGHADGEKGKGLGL